MYRDNTPTYNAGNRKLVNYNGFHPEEEKEELRDIQKSQIKKNGPDTQSQEHRRKMRWNKVTHKIEDLHPLEVDDKVEELEEMQEDLMSYDDSESDVELRDGGRFYVGKDKSDVELRDGKRFYVGKDKSDVELRDGKRFYVGKDVEDNEIEESYVKKFNEYLDPMGSWGGKDEIEAMENDLDHMENEVDYLSILGEIMDLSDFENQHSSDDMQINLEKIWTLIKDNYPKLSPKKYWGE
jgi:hypothetical protein